MTSSLSALEQLLVLSQAMLSAAGEQNWQALASRESERRALADSLPDALSSQLPGTEQARARILIEACLQCDARIQPLAARRLNELRIVLREARPNA